MKRSNHLEFALPVSEQNDAIKAAMRKLDEPTRLSIQRNAQNLIENVSAIRNNPSGLGIAGALEVLAKLGVWLNDNPALIPHDRWEPEDLKPETKR